MRRRLATYSLPVLGLVRLGGDMAAQGAGIGSRCLRHVFLLAIQRRQTRRHAFYERLGFTSFDSVREGRLHGGSAPMFLDIHSIATAVDG